MLASLLYLVIILVVIGVVLWVINSYIPMEAGIKKLVNILVIIVCAIVVVYFLINMIGGLPDFPRHRI
jgi:hypothetical protein